MKIAELQLAAFGPFENVALDLSADGLHLVYGPNEAGKTSALRAIEGFFFGIPGNSTDNFRHDYAKLRIGATLVRQDGESALLFRRKGNKNTLLDADGKAVDDARLTPFLGGLSQEVWRALFSLTRAEIEQGNADILAGKGHLGEALFSAGLGGAGVSGALADLQARSEALYKKSGSKPKINELKARHDDFRRRLVETQLSFAKWDSARKAVEQAESQTLRLRNELKGLHDRERLLERRILGRSAAESRRRALRALEAEDISETLFARSAELAALARRSGEFRKQRDALPELEARARATEAAWHEKRVHLFPGRESGETPTVSRESEECLKVHARQCIEAQRKAKEALERIEQTETRLQRTTMALAKTGVIEGVDTLKALVDEAASAGDLDAAITEGRKRTLKLEREIETALASLGLWNGGDTRALAALAVPPDATIDRFEALASEARDRINAATRDVERLESELSTRRKERQNLAAESDTPTPDRLAALRKTRDAQWGEIRAKWKAGERPSDEPALEVIFPATIAEADQVADRMMRDSQLVERRIQADRAIAQTEVALAAAGKALAVTQAAADESKQAWKAEWAECGLAPRPTREMRPWLRSRLDILEMAKRLDETSLSLTEAEAKRARLQTRLSAALSDATSDFAVLLATARQRVTDANRSEGERRQLTKQADDSSAELERAHGESTRANEVLEKARAELAEALIRCGFTADTPAEAGLVLAEDLAAHWHLDQERRRAAETAESARETVTAFTLEVAALAKAIGSSASHLDPEAHFELLESRLLRGQTLQQEIGTAEARLRDAGLGAESLEAFAESLLAEDEGAAESDLRSTHDRLVLAESEHATAIADLADAKRELAAMSGRDDSAQLEEERQNVLAELGGHATRYATLVAARELLRQAVERFREENQGPVLSRAREHFRTLTLGAFSDLRAGFNEKDEPVLRAIRATDESEVPVEGLSEGTRDQFYLALRLAGLENHLAAHGPMPLLVDDILITFDDARAEAVLKVLGELSRQIQVVLFTHHEHLIALAENALGAGKIHAHRLGGNPA
jgi:uncharacterized protein YhaN